MEKNKKLLTYLGLSFSFLLIAGGIYAYFGLLSPLHEQITAVDSEIQQQIFLKEAQSNENPVVTSEENTFPLQEEVPVEPLTDQLMLQFEKAEVLSDSLIMTMQFTDGEAAEDEQEEAVAENEDVVAAEEEPEAANTTNENATEENNTEENMTNEENESEQDPAPVAATPEVLPEGVKKITAEMSVVSKDYKGLLKFISTIEELKRVVVIEAITFTGMDELDLASPDVVLNQFKYEVTVSAYYLPELTEFLKDTPQSEFPAPNGKEDPLTSGEEKEE
jgi:type IV pilus assembly protein PilO